jgi:Fe-S-cluster-containing dehydrogenase component
MSGYGLKIDEAACWGCRTCEVACKQEFNLEAGIRLIIVAEEGPAAHIHPSEFIYRVNLCRHCDEPPCEAVCPEEAIEKREDGIVVLDEDICSGCGLCLDACPYDAIAFDDRVGQARKCNLCHQRVDNGLFPACADNVCLAHCMEFVVLDKE